MKKNLKKGAAGGNIAVFLPITKVDAAKRIVYGTITEEIEDKSGEVFDYEGSKPYFEAWSEGVSKATQGKSKGNVRVMHSSKACGKLTDLVFDDEGRRIEAAAKIVDDDEWNKVEEGVYTGFSIGGRYVKRWKDGDMEKFIADPIEVSIVDNPCVPTATFQLIKADGAEVEKEFQVWQPESSDVAKRATELATKAADGTAWTDHIEEARLQLQKEYAAEEEEVANADGEEEEVKISISECERILNSADMSDEEKTKAIRALAGDAPEDPPGFTPEKVRAILDSEDMDDAGKGEAIYAMIKEESGEGDEEEEEVTDEDTDADEVTDSEEEEEDEDDYEASDDELESAKADLAQVWKATDGKTFTKKATATQHQAKVNAGHLGSPLTTALAGLSKALESDGDASAIEIEPIEKATKMLETIRDSELVKKYFCDNDCLGPYLYDVERLADLLQNLAYLCRFYNVNAPSAESMKAQLVSMGALLLEVTNEAVASLMADLGVVTVETVAEAEVEEEVKEAFASITEDQLKKAVGAKVDLAKKAEAETELTKLQAEVKKTNAENASLKKIMEEAVPKIEDLTKQVEALKKQPNPPSHSGRVVEKTGDNGSAGDSEGSAGIDKVMAALQQMTPEERATIAIKVAQSSPQQLIDRRGGHQ